MKGEKLFFFVGKATFQKMGEGRGKHPLKKLSFLTFSPPFPSCPLVSDQIFVPLPPFLRRFSTAPSGQKRKEGKKVFFHFWGRRRVSATHTATFWTPIHELRPVVQRGSVFSQERFKSPGRAGEGGRCTKRTLSLLSPLSSQGHSKNTFTK